MTRFNITLEESINMVEWTIKNMVGGEIFVPKIPSYKITDLAKAISPNSKIKFIGLREGEKMHEEMITVSDTYNTYDLGKYFAICNPSINNLLKRYSKYKKIFPGKSYNSSQNQFLTKRIKKIYLKDI